MSKQSVTKAQIKRLEDLAHKAELDAEKALKEANRLAKIAGLPQTSFREDPVERTAQERINRAIARQNKAERAYRAAADALLNDPRHLFSTNKDLKPGTYIISGAEIGAEANQFAVAGMKALAREIGAKDVLLLPVSTARRDVQPEIDPALVAAFGNPVRSLTCGKVHAFTQFTNSNRINPALRAEQLSYASVIVASATLDFRLEATTVQSLPRLVACSGILTDANYRSTPVDLAAEARHRIGCSIVQVRKDGRFSWRSVEINPETGIFYDLNKKYVPNGKGGYKVMSNRVAGLVMGDIHSGHVDPLAWECSKALFKLLQPREVMLHDLFDGSSISHHQREANFGQAGLHAGIATLAAELETCGIFLQDLKAALPRDSKIVVVASNHDEFLARALSGAAPKDVVKDAASQRIFIKSMTMLMDGVNPLPALVDPTGTARWLNRLEDHFVAGVLVSQHGDAGVNGARSWGVASRKKNVVASVTGHTHSPASAGGNRHVTAGCTEYLRPGYNRTLSSWLHGHVAIHEDGTMQSLLIVEGCVAGIQAEHPKGKLPPYLHQEIEATSPEKALAKAMAELYARPKTRAA